MQIKEKRLLFIVTGIILAGALALHVWKIMNDTFWYDELYTISFIRDGRSLMDLFRIFVTDEVTNPPLYDFLLYFYYRLVPHTEFILLLPSLFAFIIGEVFCGLFVWNVSGKKILPVMLVLCILPFNTFSMRVITSELRSYGMLFMLSAVFLFCYERTRNNDSLKNIILSGVVLSLLSVTHYYGVILISFFGLLDLVLIIRKKIHLRNIIMYIMPACISGGWLFTALHFTKKDVSKFWTSPPAIKDLLHVASWMLGSKFLFLVTVIGIILLFFAAVRSKNFEKDRTIWLLLGCIMYMMTMTFIYSAYVNSAGGIFVARYFTVCIPEAVALNVLIVDRLTGKIQDKPYISLMVLVLCFIMVLSTNINNIPVFTEDFSNYRNTSKRLAELYESPETDAVVLHNNQEKDYLSQGFKAFYMDGRGEYNLVDESDIDKLNSMNRIFFISLSKGEVDEGFYELTKDYSIEDYREDSDLLIYRK